MFDFLRLDPGARMMPPFVDLPTRVKNYSRHDQNLGRYRRMATAAFAYPRLVHAMPGQKAHPSEAIAQAGSGSFDDHCNALADADTH